MNKRKAKKKFGNQFLLGKTYTTHKRIIRQQHENSIELARLEHRNFWEEWKRGYPNRFPYQKWFMCKNFMN